MPSDENPETPFEELTRLVQEGKSPEDVAAQAQRVVGNFLGNGPPGTYAPNNGSRQMIGGAGSLFELLRYGFFGVICTAIGIGIVKAGSSGQVDRTTFAVGAAVLAFGIFALWKAARAWRSLRGVSRA